MGRQDYVQALAAYDTAIALDPNNLFAYTNKALALIELKGYAEALTVADQAIRVNGQHPRGWQRRAAALRGLGREAEAQEAERRAKELGG